MSQFDFVSSLTSEPPPFPSDLSFRLCISRYPTLYSIMERLLDMSTKEELVLRATTTWNSLHTQTREVTAKVSLFAWLEMRTLKTICLFIGAWFSVSVSIRFYVPSCVGLIRSLG